MIEFEGVVKKFGSSFVAIIPKHVVEQEKLVENQEIIANRFNN